MSQTASTAVARLPRSLVRYGLYGVLTSWLGLTVAKQFRKTPQFMIKIDPINTAVPVTTFFAPNPGKTDIHLLTREKLDDGSMTQWSEHPLISPRSLRHMLWHPGRRVEKLLPDAVAELAQVVLEEKRIEYIQLTIPYLSMLNFVTHQCRHPADARQVQFLIVESPGHAKGDDPRTLFASQFHELPVRI
ncbi:hypothetical protein G5C60_02225 [Streptomyces sp. HC44]|uniref:Uncharacterized protein n=1 Tax=Streptomyces scabichelini TaxID=2711217 RepID=A0A6G4UXL5_9ACTN|nr:hypothetical protein [Streptomyces scabichelini]NGO06518.1 hypothetical protein [Streptomyces scabichelini]